MGPSRKIATCCYCGRRAALVLKGAVQHELACTGCGAPLHDLKMLPKPKVETVEKWTYVPQKIKKKPKSRKKPKLSKWVKDLWDEIEDVFD